MERKLLAWLLVVSLLAGCISQQKPTPTTSPTPVNNPPIANFSYSWTGGDKDQPWTCSKITFKAEVSDPDGDKINLTWYDNGNPIWKCSNNTSCETKLWPDGTHTIQLKATDAKGAQSVLEKQIDVKYEVPEPIPLQTKNGVNIVAYYTPMGIESSSGVGWSTTETMPLLGRYDIKNPVTVDWHIKWALEHGINQMMLWIMPWAVSPEEISEKSIMRYYPDGFLKAKYKDKIKFSVWIDMRFYNPYKVEKDYPLFDLEKDVEVLSKHYFNEANYTKVNGKPVLGVLLADNDGYFCDTCENKNEKKDLYRSNIELIRETAKKNGYDLFLIGGLEHKRFKNDEVETTIIESTDAVTSFSIQAARDMNKYQWTTNKNGIPILVMPYDHMVDYAIKREIELQNLTKKSNKLYIPYVSPGFDNEKRNWFFVTKLTDPTPKKFEEWLTAAEPLINQKANMLFTTLNEFDEGRGIEPTKEFGFAYLDIIRDNFAIKPAGGWLPNIVPTKNCGCTEYKNGNTEIGIPPPFVFGFFGVENELLKILKARKEERLSPLESSAPHFPKESLSCRTFLFLYLLSKG